MMRRTRRSLVLVAAIAALLLSNWGASPAGAWPPEGDRPDPATLPGPGNPGEQRTTVQYGPFSIQGAPEGDEIHSGNQFAFNVEKPCSNCYITGMQANLTDPATGETIGVKDGTMLHHMVLFNSDSDRTDNTCEWGLPVPLGGILGQRFFASGDERTPIISQPGYGYQVDNGSWNLIWEMSNHMQQPRSAYFEVTFDYVPASQAGDMTDLEPIWFDLFQCGTSQISVPAGPYSQSWSWNSNLTGDIIGIGGHVHAGGVNIEVTNDSTGELVCDSVASYGGHPLYMNHHGEGALSTMSTCGGWDDPDFRSPVSQGDTLTLTGHYNEDEPDPGQMGIVIAYLAEDTGGGGDCAWWMELFGLC